ncbi:hypothetical protein [Nocardia sp. CNY236]|uniref:hypothetical protein n=1 Tax=Nocardia sp. CNY236 TaxID=1169152 RepID=UPI00040BEE3A|nr:hypothetical protein [Nocardia sp. CNY236]
MISHISNSYDLAAVLNAPPAAPADATETPRDWPAGIWVAGTVYPLDAEASTSTLVVLADGTAAVRQEPSGLWAPADREEWTANGDARGAVRDCRSVHAWDANGFVETEIYSTVEAAACAYQRKLEILAGWEQAGDDAVGDTWLWMG